LNILDNYHQYCSFSFVFIIVLIIHYLLYHHLSSLRLLFLNKEEKGESNFQHEIIEIFMWLKYILM